MMDFDLSEVVANQLEESTASSRADESEAVRQALEVLINLRKPRGQQAIRLRFGLDQEKEILQILELTRERIHQIKAKALARLRVKANLPANGLRKE